MLKKFRRIDRKWRWLITVASASRLAYEFVLWMGWWTLIAAVAATIAFWLAQNIGLALLVVILTTAFVFCAVSVGGYFWQARKDRLADQISAAQTTASPPSPAPRRYATHKVEELRSAVRALEDIAWGRRVGDADDRIRRIRLIADDFSGEGQFTIPFNAISNGIMRFNGMSLFPRSGPDAADGAMQAQLIQETHAAIRTVLDITAANVIGAGDNEQVALSKSSETEGVRPHGLVPEASSLRPYDTSARMALLYLAHGSWDALPKRETDENTAAEWQRIYDALRHFYDSAGNEHGIRVWGRPLKSLPLKLIERSHWGHWKLEDRPLFVVEDAEMRTIPRDRHPIDSNPYFDLRLNRAEVENLRRIVCPAANT